MSAVKIKLQPWFRRSIYVVLGISWLTGLTFFIMNNWAAIEGDFGPEKHPLQFKVLVVHGAAAFLMLMIFGSMLSNHLPMAWKTNRLRKIGITLTSFVIIQILSAFLLYYLSSDSVRAVVVWVHLLAGMTLPVVLTTHVLVGRQRSRSRQGKTK
ncbi:MAG: hypothetical protein R3E90_16000 [Marinicella sp.]|nr:hypothetical protein [Xanthomonadales bacterium]